jgi:hypothetical protein
MVVSSPTEGDGTVSVDFQIESLSTGQFTFTCYEQNQRMYGPFDSYDDALLAVTAHKMECPECDVYGCYANAVLDVDVYVNMSNANAAMILAVLGLDVDPEDGIMGHMDAEQFLGHVLMALAAERDNAAVLSVTDSLPGCATFIDCGLPEGYVEERLTQLADLATEAVRLSRTVCWA